MMVWLLVFVLIVIALTGVFALVFLVTSPPTNSRALEHSTINCEVRRPERLLHDLSSEGFSAMLEEARVHGLGKVR